MTSTIDSGPTPVAAQAGHLADLRQAESILAASIDDAVALRATALTFYGTVGRRERLPFWPALYASGSGLFPAVPLWAMVFADALAMGGLAAAAPEAELSGSASGAAVALRVLIFGLGGLLALRLLDQGLARVSLARSASLAAAVGLVCAASAVGSGAAFLAASAVAIASGVTTAVILPVLFDSYRPELRVRLVGGVVAAILLGLGASRIVVVLSSGAGLSWRSALLVMAVAPLGAAAAAARVAEPAVGARDQARVAALVQRYLGGTGDRGAELNDDDVGIGSIARFRRVLAFSSAGGILVAAASFGMYVWGLPEGISILVRDRWGVFGPGQGLIYGAICLAAVPGVVWFAARAESAFRNSVKDLLLLAAHAAVVAAVALGVAATVPVLWLAFLLLVLSFSAVAGLLVAATVLLLTVRPASERSHAAVLLGLVVLVGAQLGPAQVVTIGSRFGIDWGIILLATIGTTAAASLGKGLLTIEGDMQSSVGAAVERQELAAHVSLGHHLPLLSCRGINFAYGQVQVLFNVSFTVDDGEMVALLGTNGAGKSTLLRVVSGLELPQAGSIHYRGADITFLGSERRVELGISQIPGGKAVFGNLTVMDNLRAYGYTLGRDKAQLDRGIDEAMSALPRLAERRNQLAATLSGGERQMLALAKAYLLRPRLLVIDELSLGLAPKVVGELLGAVRQINAAGTAIVLVEQSVNVALSVVDHAYFMEKGEMRFDGIARELIARPDILRSVFLEGASKGLKSAGAVR